MQKERYDFMDIAKGIGIIFVILAHIGVGNLGFLFYTFHLPLFFIIAGYFFKYKENSIDFIKSKIKSYLIPYICCSLILILYLCIIKKFNFFIILEKFLFQKRYTTLWFLSALFFSIILFYIIFKIFKQQKFKIYVACLILSIIFIIFDKLTKKSLIWNIDTSFIVLFYLSFGYLLKDKKILDKFINKNVKKRLYYSTLFLIVCITLSMINYHLCKETYEMFFNRYGIFPLTLSAGCMGSLSIILISSCLTKLKILKWIGENTMSFFAFHQTIGIDIMLQICNKIPLFSVFSIKRYYLKIFVIFTGVMIICYLIHIILIHLKLGFALGKKNKSY